MIHAYDQRFDVTGNLENFCELNKALWILYSRNCFSQCFWQFDSIGHGKGKWATIHEDSPTESMLTYCGEATTAKGDGGQQERAADGAERGITIRSVFFATLIICVKTLLLVLESHLLRQQILRPVF